jgi:hypothetical protein
VAIAAAFALLSIPGSLRADTSPLEQAQPAQSARFYLSAEEIEGMRSNVLRFDWARTAWEKTKARADAALAESPQPADPLLDYGPKGPDPCEDSQEGWFCGLYQPGLQDGLSAHSLALAYALTGESLYGAKAKEFILAWARVYNPPAKRVGHTIAEPVGFMLKGFLAYDLVQDLFTESERAEVRQWAAQFVPRGEALADKARDAPWVPSAPYGNGATWPRALAVMAAAVAGEPYLSATLAWNWEHVTPGGNDYGWSRLLEGAMDTRGQMVEESVRKSIGYALYTWHPLALIADVARHAGFEHDLWTAATPSGKSLSLPIDYYAPYLTEQLPDPYAAVTTGCCYAPYDTVLSEYRAAMELAYRALPDSHSLAEVVNFGGDQVRGQNYDQHISGWNAITGVQPLP